MKQYQYKNYEDYLGWQKHGAHVAWDHVVSHKTSIELEWVTYEEIVFLKDEVINPHFNKAGVTPLKGICHGAKLGKENLWFEQETGIDFIGTDISVETDTDKKILCWDFHNVKEEWINNIDVIYSNSFDHAFDPIQALAGWLSCLTDNGICITELYASESTATDPLSCTSEEFMEMIKKSGGKLISTPTFKTHKLCGLSSISYFVFSKRRPVPSGAILLPRE